MFQAPTELQLLTARKIEWLAQVTVITLIIRLQLKYVQAIIKVLLQLCFQINSPQLTQLRIKEKELHSSKDKSKRCRSSRGIVRQIVVLIHHKCLLLKFISNKCTRQLKLLQQPVRRKYAKASKMSSNRETSLRSKSSASTHTTSSLVQFTLTVLNQLSYQQKLYNLLIKRK